MYAFGAGNLFLVSGNDKTRIGTLQDITVTPSYETKTVYGAYQFPVAAGRGKAKFDISAKWVEIRAAQVASFFTGSVVTTGGTFAQVAESHSAAASVAITPPSSGTFGADLGVTYSTGVPLKYNSGTPAVGEYKQSSGTYTFNASETGTLLISYEYTLAASGSTIALSNQLMGSQTTYQVGLYNTAPDGSKYGIKLYAVTLDNMSLPFKNEDFTVPDVKGTAFADSSGNILSAYFPA